MFNHINPQNELGFELFDFQSQRKEENLPFGDNSEIFRKGSTKGRPKGQKNRQVTERKKKQNQKNINKKVGHWSIEENKKYHWFLELHSKHFLQKHLRRSDKIFKTMEIFLGTREAEQCRSHHQKMQKKYKTFQQILLNLRHQYFGTDDSAPIAHQLQKNGIIIPDGIVSANLLLDKESKEEEGKIQNAHQEFHQEIKPFMNFYDDRKLGEDIMGDEYQNQLDFKFLL